MGPLQLSVLLLAAAFPAVSAACNKTIIFQGTEYTFPLCVDLDGDASLAWVLTEKTNLTAIFTGRPSRKYGWCAWGLTKSQGKMIGGSSAAGFCNQQDNTQCKAEKYKMTEKLPTGVFAGQSDLTFLKDPQVQVLNSGNTFQLYLQINYDESTWQQSDGNVYMIWSSGPLAYDYPGGGLLQHNKTERWSSTVDFSSGSSVTVQISSPITNQYAIHSWLVGIGFGVMMPMGIIIARHIKVVADPLWYYAHIACQLIGYILGVTGFGYGVWLWYQNYVSLWNHYGVGIGIMVTSSLQMTTPIVKPEKTSGVRLYWNLVHWSLGYATVIMTFINVFSGFGLLEQSVYPPDGGYGNWRFVYWVFMWCWVGLYVLLDLITWPIWFMRRNEGGDEKPEKNAEQV